MNSLEITKNNWLSETIKSGNGVLIVTDIATGDDGIKGMSNLLQNLLSQIDKSKQIAVLKDKSSTSDVSGLQTQYLISEDVDFERFDYHSWHYLVIDKIGQLNESFTDLFVDRLPIIATMLMEYSNEPDLAIQELQNHVQAHPLGWADIRGCFRDCISTIAFVHSEHSYDLYEILNAGGSYEEKAQLREVV